MKKDDSYSRVLIKHADELHRICSLHLSLETDDLYVELKPKRGHQYKMTGEGIGGVNYVEGSYTKNETGPSMSGIGHVHFVIPENKTLLTYREKGGATSHTAHTLLPDKKTRRFLRIAPHFDDFPIHDKPISKQDFVFDDTRLFLQNPIYVDFWLTEEVPENDQGNFQSVMQSKYIRETGRVSQVLGGRGGIDGQYGVAVAIYQPRKATPLGFTRLTLPGTPADS